MANSDSTSASGAAWNGGCFGLCPRPTGSLDTEVYKFDGPGRPWTRADLMMLSSCCCCELGYRYPDSGDLWSSEVFSRCCCQRQYYQCICFSKNAMHIVPTKEVDASRCADVAADGAFLKHTYPESAKPQSLGLGHCKDDCVFTNDRFEYTAFNCCWQMCDTGCGAYECCCNQKARYMCLHYTCSFPKSPFPNRGIWRRVNCNSHDHFHDKCSFGCCGVYCCGRPTHGGGDLSDAKAAKAIA